MHPISRNYKIIIRIDIHIVRLHTSIDIWTVFDSTLLQLYRVNSVQVLVQSQLTIKNTDCVVNSRPTREDHARSGESHENLSSNCTCRAQLSPDPIQSEIFDLYQRHVAFKEGLQSPSFALLFKLLITYCYYNY